LTFVKVTVNKREFDSKQELTGKKED